MQAEQIAGLVLAGGRSRRMGCDKAQLRLQGQSLLERQQDLLHGFCHGVYISSNTLKQANTIKDRLPNCGPLGGILSALEHLSATAYLLVLAVDMPHLNRQVIDELLRFHAKRQGHCHYQHAFFPLILENTPLLRRQLNDSVRQGEYRISEALRIVKSHALLASNENKNQLVNVNTPEQWARALTDLH